jgi:beta-ketoacyl-acyl-carrier-protein synthase II
MPERIVITGMGTVSPLGLSVDETWENVINGVSGIGPITLFDASNLDVHIAAEVKNFNPRDLLTYRQARRRDRVQQLTTVATKEAIIQAQLDRDDLNLERIGVVVSSAIGGMNSLEDNMNVMAERGHRKVSPFAVTQLMINGAAAYIAIDYGFQGPAFGVVSACSTGADSLGIAWTLLRSGAADIIVAGSAEAPITTIGIAGFDRLGAASHNNDDYSMTPQPFDKNRNGLVIGEAAAILVLELESHARKRGVEIFGELAGYAATEDAYHIVAPSEDGSGGARAIINALDTAEVDKSEVDYINAHGTATVLNDLSETRAIKMAFGEQAFSIPVSSTKSMTGHTMGAAGSLEAILCLQTVRDNIIPPTIHYQTPDPLCDLDYVPNQAREQDVHIALSNSFGFGGHNAVLVIKEYS